MATKSIVLSSLQRFPSILKPKSLHSASPFSLPTNIPSHKPNFLRITGVSCQRSSTKLWRISGVSEDFLLSDVNPLEDSEQIVSANGDGVSNIISLLLFVAFIGLSVLSIGVVYIAVTDFLQKREGEKFEKEEAAKKKKGGKKGKVRARNGPKGFGQKIEEEDEYD